MGILIKTLWKKDAEQAKTGGMEDYMTLVRVYFQAVLAARLGINNLAMLPDLVHTSKHSVYQHSITSWELEKKPVCVRL